MSARRLLTVLGILGGLARDETARAVKARRDGASAEGAEEGGTDTARTVRLALERLGPFYVKIGQMLSNRPDIVPPAVMTELATLHDHVTTVPFSAWSGGSTGG